MANLPPWLYSSANFLHPPPCSAGNQSVTAGWITTPYESPINLPPSWCNLQPLSLPLILSRSWWISVHSEARWSMRSMSTTLQPSIASRIGLVIAAGSWSAVWEEPGAAASSGEPVPGEGFEMFVCIQDERCAAAPERRQDGTGGTRDAPLPGSLQLRVLWWHPWAFSRNNSEHRGIQNRQGCRGCR